VAGGVETGRGRRTCRYVAETQANEAAFGWRNICRQRASHRAADYCHAAHPAAGRPRRRTPPEHELTLTTRAPTAPRMQAQVRLHPA
jgi:hypothetical protein